MNTWEAVVTILGMGLITLLTRAFFLLPRRDVPMPGWLREGLRYAPLAALTAVVAPEVLMSQGHLITTLIDARLPAVVTASAWYFWRRDILGTILVGTGVMLAFRLGLGW